VINYGVAEHFGGVKDSGIGRVNGEMGLKSYCHVQGVLIDRFGTRVQAILVAGGGLAGPSRLTFCTAPHREAPGQ
jgi:hypothetical protein